MKDEPVNRNAAAAETIFNAALNFKAAERPAYLAGACGDNPPLRQRVEALLRAHEEAPGFLPDPSPPPIATIKLNLPKAADEAVGQTLGRYKLLEKIGEGGCGVVYVAEQTESVRRRVALKVIKLGMDTKEVIARFKAERQALALMDHPNIAKVLDAGASESGRPFYVMELVKGIPITRYCDENKLNTRERLNLFIQVCHAIQHAHQKGIIHRDLKPSNILVADHDGKAVPKVIDFGIAKATSDQRLTDKTLYTAIEQFIGTPAYMSPEQAKLSGLDIDTRSDIYSLGVLLYELLTGRTPFDAQELIKDGLEAIRRTICEVEPPRPSTRLSTLQGEDLTATAKQHGSEGMQLLKMIRGDLDWIVMKCLEKDRTRRYGTANGLASDLQRHLDNEPVFARPPSTAYRLQKAWRRHKAAFAVAALIAAVLVAATGISVWQALRSTRAETLAEQRLIESEAISKFLKELFQSLDPASEGHAITVAETLAAAAKKLEADLTNQPARRAELQATLGETYEALGLAREAIPLREKVRDYYLTNSGPEDPDTLVAMNNLASSYGKAGRNDEALKLREQVLAAYRKVSGPEDLYTLGAMLDVASSYEDASRLDEALKLREQVLALYRKVSGPEDISTLSAMNDLALSYDEAGRRGESLKLKEQVLALYRKVSGPEHPSTLVAMNNLADSYNEVGRRDEALKLREELVVLCSKVLGPEHPDSLDAMENLADSYDEASRRDEALKLREKLVVLRGKVLGPEHPATLNAMNKLADSYAGIGRRDEAIKLQQQVLAISRKVRGPENPASLAVMIDLAKSFGEAGRLQELIALLEKFCELDRTNADVSLTLATLQTCFGQEADYEATRLRLVQQAEGTDKAWTAECAARAVCLRQSTDAALLTKALNLAQRAVELGKGDPYLPWYQLTLGLAEYRKGQYTDAERTLTVAEQMGGKIREIPGIARLFRAMSLFRHDKPEEARKLFSQAEAQMPPLPEDPHFEKKSASRDELIWWMAYKEAKSVLNAPALAKP